MQRDSIKHCFKPEINPVSKMIAEKDKPDLNWNKSEVTDVSISQQLINISVHEKLHLSRNNSQWCLQQSKGLGSRSNSVADFKTYWSKMQKITEREEKSSQNKEQKSSRSRALRNEAPITPQVSWIRYKSRAESISPSSCTIWKIGSRSTTKCFDRTSSSRRMKSSQMTALFNQR